MAPPCSLFFTLFSGRRLTSPAPRREAANLARVRSSRPPRSAARRTRQATQQQYTLSLALAAAMRPTLAALAQIGRLATPPPSAAVSTVPPELKVRDFFREVS